MKKGIVAAALFAGALMAGPAAHAGDVDVGISIGIPGFVWGGPAYYPPPAAPLSPPARRRSARTRLCVRRPRLPPGLGGPRPLRTPPVQALEGPRQTPPGRPPVRPRLARLTDFAVLRAQAASATASPIRRRSVRAASAASNASSPSRVIASVNWPSAPNFSWAAETNSSGLFSGSTSR